MLSRQTPHSEFETIWAIVNALDRTTAADDEFNHGRYLNRQEFVQSLVRMAIAVYVQRGVVGDVSDAVNRLMVSNLARFLPPGATQNSNAFRKRFCYIERTSRVLEHHAPSLRALYTPLRTVPSSACPPNGVPYWPLLASTVTAGWLARSTMN